MRKPREPYGRQMGGQTIKSASIDADVATWLEEMAAKCNKSASGFVNALLKDLRSQSIQHPASSIQHPGEGGAR
jgi:hypothetical protein